MKWNHRIGSFLAACVLTTIAGFASAKPAEAAAGYADLSTMGNGHEVTSDYVVDGDYKFVPTVTDQTQIVFNGNWDNTFCRNSEADVNYISRFYPYADTRGWGNTRSAILTNDKKGNLSVDLKNVGEYNGEIINMKVTLTDWTNFTNLPSSDYANVFITMGGDTRLPQINIICVQNISVKFSYYNNQGQPVSLKGHYTLNDLDYNQGFKILSSGGDVYYTKEAAARMGYDAATQTIWADSSSTDPNNEVGWVTYTFEGSETQLQFFVDVVNPKSKDYQYQKWDVSKWENLPNSAKGNLHWYYKGANHTNVDESTYTAWITSEFGYTSEAVMRFSPKANVVVTKTDAETGEALTGATFTCYEWTGSGWKDIGNLEWQNVYKYYWKTGLERNGINQGRFKVVETKNPSGYTGSWEKEFTVTEEGTVTLKYDATNTRKKGTITIRKTDAENGAAITGATFQVIAKNNITTAGGKVLVKAGTVVDTVTVNNGTATTKALELGSYTVKETAAAPGYVLTGQSQEVTLSDSQTERTVDYKNTPNKLVLQKVSKNDGTVLAGVEFKIWAKTESENSADTYKTDKNGRITVQRLAPGTYCYKESKTLDGYLLDSTVREFTVGKDGKVNGQASATLTVENDYTKLDLAKVDASTGQPVAGAKMALYKGNEKIASWTSGNSPHRIEKLAPGEYTLVEEAAPNGYQLAESITFTFEQKAEVQSVTMKDLRYTDLTVVKKIKTDEITWAHGNPTFIFTVEGTDLFGVHHKYQKFVAFTEDYVEKNTDGQGYVEASITFKNIPMGKDYAVTELQVLRYGLVAVTGTDNVTIQQLQEPEYGLSPSEIFHVSANLEKKPTGTSVTFENKKYRWDDYSHNNIVENVIPMEK